MVETEELPEPPEGWYKGDSPHGGVVYVSPHRDSHVYVERVQTTKGERLQLTLKSGSPYGKKELETSTLATEDTVAESLESLID